MVRWNFSLLSHNGYTSIQAEDEIRNITSLQDLSLLNILNSIDSELDRIENKRPMNRLYDTCSTYLHPDHPKQEISQLLIAYIHSL
jgi:hypothetical protein